jgi:hypothetical protein
MQVSVASAWANTSRMPAGFGVVKARPPVTAAIWSSSAASASGECGRGGHRDHADGAPTDEELISFDDQFGSF